MHRVLLTSALMFAGAAWAPWIVAAPLATETVYVETQMDTDGDGNMDRIYVQIERPSSADKLPAIVAISPYAMGGNNVPNHDVNVRRLPQDTQMFVTEINPNFRSEAHRLFEDLATISQEATRRGYASVTVHSLGTGRSQGCPTVGDEAETLAAKAVIDWLNGRASAFSSATGSSKVTASWANGNVGMTGVSYNGTLPNMVATTGVEGLKAIVPIAAISSWYDYYRANGLVVGPGGYIGEDADVLGRFIVRKGACEAALKRISQEMGREHGDFTPFWQNRDYISRASGVTAAVFILHGQSDWNVRQSQAIRWWEALQGRVPLRMWLHKGGHSSASRSDTSAEIWRWFDRYVKGIDNGVEDEAAIEVESANAAWTVQRSWPSELTVSKRLYLNAGHELAETAGASGTGSFIDAGKTTRFENMLSNPATDHPARLAFVTPPFAAPHLLSGTPRITLDLAVMNRQAANITVGVVEYNAAGRSRLVTLGWADPQNYADKSKGELLIQGQRYQLTFALEPKQYTFAQGSRIGIVIAATDYDHTIRPDNGTEVSVALGRDSYVELNLSRD